MQKHTHMVWIYFFLLKNIWADDTILNLEIPF